MAEKQEYDKYDPRLESLVMETRTLWDAAAGGDLSGAERTRLAEEAHQQPQEATRIQYERSHTGFVREITITAADLQRLK